MGREMALTLAEASADVVLASRNIEGLNETTSLIQRMGREAFVCPMDITKLDDIERAVGDAIAAFGRIDILINNSGIAGEAPVADMTPEKWDRVMDVNLKGHVFCTKAVGRHMIANQYDKIINIGSIVGIIPMIYSSTYGVAKAGLILFTKTLALEWARYNIQANALCPGDFLTDLNRVFFNPSRAKSHQQDSSSSRGRSKRDSRGDAPFGLRRLEFHDGIGDRGRWGTHSRIGTLGKKIVSGNGGDEAWP